MSGLRTRPKGTRNTSFGLFLLAFGVFPNSTGYQDIGALLARQPGITERWQKQVLLPSIGAVRVATFNLARPIGTSVQLTAYERLASIDDQAHDVTGSIARNPLGQPIQRLTAADFPKVNREHKSDRLPLPKPEVLEAPQPADAAQTEKANGPPALAAPDVKPAAPVPAVPQATPKRVTDGAGGPIDTVNPSEPVEQAAQAGDGAALDPELQAALNDKPLVQYAVPKPTDGRAGQNDQASLEGDTADEVLSGNFVVQTTRLYFGNGSFGPAENLESWQPGEAPQILGADPDMKRTVLPGAAAPAGEGTTVAGKGEVTGEDQRPKTPAERLGLVGKARDKAEKCLAEAVYFEARGEKVRGQIAVAQVVMNRVFSGFYPTNVCGVVYQNKHRHLACQFTFACDNVPDVVREPDMWERAKKIAKAMLDGSLWLPEVAKSTHYHAYWVHPSWVGEMKKMYKYGVHTFYRPRAWGDGSDTPSWGTPAQTAAISAELAAVKD